MELTDARVAELERIAFQFAARVRTCDPEDNRRWLVELLPDPHDWFRLNFVLAAAVPEDRPWSEMTRWTHQTKEERESAVPLAFAIDPASGRVMKGCGTPAAARRHKERGEDLDPACRDAIRAENRLKKRRYRAKATAQLVTR
ncbi:hypothetical protein [Actinoplanes sp. NPDC048796]|uniref:hypothetical protein n=1 Tax=Actinoplanes sp. NPDC048796 TaxID=3155640 RepID=UPI0033CA4570